MTGSTGGSKDADQGNAYPGLGVLSVFTVLLAVSLGIAVATTVPAQHISLSEVLPWSLLVFAVDLVPVRSDGRFDVDIDLPILLAAGFVFGPLVAGALSLLWIDVDELRGELPFVVALFNRSQKCVAVLAATWTFWLLGGPSVSWPLIICLVLVAVAVDSAINVGMVALAGRVVRGTLIREGVRAMLGTDPKSMIITYVTSGMGALVLSQLYWSVGTWALLAFPIPLMMARMALAGMHGLSDATTQIEQRDRALRRVPEELARERADERLAIAATLHDDLVQSLHFLTLHAQVIREDLRHGQLLRLDEDVPALVRVSQDAAEVARSIIGGLRRSPLGADGLLPTLQSLVARLQEDFTGSIDLVVTDVGSCDEEALLVTYQVARETLMNVVKHAGADRATVEISRQEDDLLVSVRDDGCGFQPALVDETRHFGLALLAERVRLSGGLLEVSASPGQGTHVTARIPCRLARDRGSRSG